MSALTTKTRKYVITIFFILLAIITLPPLFQYHHPWVPALVLLAFAAFLCFWLLPSMTTETQFPAPLAFYYRHRREIFFVLFCFFLYSAWASVIPFNDAPDEGLRYRIPLYIFNHNRLPLGNDPEIITDLWGVSYGYQPMLAYQFAAFVMELTAFFKLTNEHLYLAARFANVLLSTGTAVTVLAIGRKCFTAQRALLLASLVCLLPSYVFTTSYVNTDGLAIFSTALIFYAWVRGLEKHWDLKSCLLLAIGVALCALSYYNAYGTIVASAVIYLGDYFIHRKKWPVKRFLLSGLLMIALVLILAGWWFVRSAILYDGDILGLRSTNALGEALASDAFKPSLHQTPQKDGWSVIKMLFVPYNPLYAEKPSQLNWIILTYISFLGLFGYMVIKMNKIAYILLCAIQGLGGIGFLLWLKKHLSKLKKPRNLLWAIVLAIAIVMPVALSIYYSFASDYQPQGRYILPLLVPLMYLLTIGLGYLEDALAKRLKGLSLSWVIIGLHGLIIFHCLCQVLMAA